MRLLTAQAGRSVEAEVTEKNTGDCGKKRLLRIKVNGECCIKTASVRNISKYNSCEELTYGCCGNQGFES